MLKFLRGLISQKRTVSSSAVKENRPNERVSPISVSYDEIGVSVLVEGEVKQKVEWSGIDLIAIRIEDDFLPFPYWYVGNKDNLLRIPNNAVGSEGLFFDGFSEHITGYKSDATFKVIIEASAAMKGSFIVWKSENATAA